MTELLDLKQLTDEAKDALILALWEELQMRQKKKPKKTSKNSSLPPAKGFKAEVKSAAKAGEQRRIGSLGRAGGDRLSPPTPANHQTLTDSVANFYHTLWHSSCSFTQKHTMQQPSFVLNLSLIVIQKFSA